MQFGQYQLVRPFFSQTFYIEKISKDPSFFDQLAKCFHMSFKGTMHCKYDKKLHDGLRGMMDLNVKPNLREVNVKLGRLNREEGGDNGISG